VDLRAHTAGHRPLTAAAALGTLLSAAGVSGKRIPDDLGDRAALWRATMAGRRVLLVLDNAATAPRSSRCCPAIPSAWCSSPAAADSPAGRRPPAVAGRAARTDAVALFERVVGDTRPAAEPEAVAEVLELCGYLPLAIRLPARA